MPKLSGAPVTGKRASPMVFVDVRAAQGIAGTSGIRVFRGNRVSVVQPGVRKLEKTAQTGSHRSQMKLIRIGASPRATYTELMSDKRILLIIGGGIAAYKSLELIRELGRRGIACCCILTSGGSQFVTPLSVSALSGEKVFTGLFDLDDEAEMGHIQLSRSADLVVVCPATADLMAKAVHGHANDLAACADGARDECADVAACGDRPQCCPAARRRRHSDGAGRRRDGLRRVWSGPPAASAGDCGRD